LEFHPGKHAFKCLVDLYKYSRTSKETRFVSRKYHLKIYQPFRGTDLMQVNTDTHLTTNVDNFSETEEWFL